MARYARLQANGGTIDGIEAINRTALLETHKPQNIMAFSNTSITAYGFGWDTIFTNNRVRIEHGGDLSSGVSTYVTLWPDERMAIVVLTNAFPGGHVLKRSMTLTWEDLYFTGAVQDDYFGVLTREITEALKPGSAVVGPATELPPAPADAEAPRPLSSYTGSYAQEYYGTVRIGTDGTNLLAYPGRLADPIALAPYDGDTFRETLSNTSVEFTTGDSGNASAVHFDLFDKAWVDGTFLRV